MQKMIGLSTTYYATQGKSVYESVRKIAELGFNTVEMGAAHVFEEDIWDIIRKIKKDFTHAEFTIHTLFPPQKDRVWFNPADGLSGINRNIIDNLFSAAELLETTRVSIHPAIFNEVRLGLRGNGNFHTPAVGEPKNRNDCIEKFRDVMHYASKKAVFSGITLLVENMDTLLADCYPASRDDFGELFKEFPNTGLLLDIGHAAGCENISELLDLGRYIHEVHIHGNDNNDNGKSSHSSIKNEAYFYPLKNRPLNESTVFLFEHGSDVSEDEIRFEKILLEQFLCDNHRHITDRKAVGCDEH